MQLRGMLMSYSIVPIGTSKVVSAFDDRFCDDWQLMNARMVAILSALRKISKKNMEVRKNVLYNYNKRREI